MEKPERWHVFVNDETGKRFCFYSFWNALTFNDAGGFLPVCQGKKEIPLDEWTGEELCWMNFTAIRSVNTLKCFFDKNEVNYKKMESEILIK